MRKWWMVWFTVPAIVNLWWESKPKDKRESAIDDITEAFMYTGSAWKKIWQKDKPEPKPKPLKGVRIDLADFDAMLINTDGHGCGRTNSSEFNIGKNGKIKPGTYKKVMLESPSMDALKYARMEAWPERNRWSVDIAGSAKTLYENDTIDMGINIDIGGVPLGEVHFKWDCE